MKKTSNKTTKVQAIIIVILLVSAFFLTLLILFQDRDKGDVNVPNIDEIQPALLDK